MSPSYFLASVVAFLLLCASRDAHALKFANSFTEFELPPQWSCALEGAAWTCETSDDTSQSDAVMVLAAKKKGDADTLAQYQEQLGKAKTVRVDDGTEVVSKPQYVKLTEINGAMWVDSMHLDSEMQGYATRYIATIKEDIAILITYSIEKTKVATYTPQFDALVRSIRVFRARSAPPAATAPAPQQQLLSTGIPMPTGQVFPVAAPETELPKAKPKSKGGTSESTNSLLMLALAGGLAFYLYKKRRGET